MFLFLFSLSLDGKLLLEMNRILRPGGYFILSSKHDSIEEEEGLPCSSSFYFVFVRIYPQNSFRLILKFSVHELLYRIRTFY